jgi:hypothetical protein
MAIEIGQDCGMAGPGLVTAPDMGGAMTGLILKRASASRSSGEWNDDDFDVLAYGTVVGRIFKANAAPVGSPGMWTLASAITELARRT